MCDMGRKQETILSPMAPTAPRHPALKLTGTRRTNHSANPFAQDFLVSLFLHELKKYGSRCTQRLGQGENRLEGWRFSPRSMFDYLLQDRQIFTPLSAEVFTFVSIILSRVNLDRRRKGERSAILVLSSDRTSKSVRPANGVTSTTFVSLRYNPLKF
jgi:hypothetical protein